MNSVNEMVKYLILSSSMGNMTRLGALKQIFMVNGNGLEWKDGALVDRWGDQYKRDGMDYSFVDKQIAKYEGEAARDPDFAHLKSILVGYRKTRMDMQYIEQNIDVYTTSHVDDDRTMSGRSIDWIEGFDPDWCKLSARELDAAMPIQKEWAEAIHELGGIVRGSIFRHFHLYMCASMRDKSATVMKDGSKAPSFDELFAQMPEKYQRIYNFFNELDDKLDAITNRKALSAEREALASRLIDEIVSEDKAKKAAQS